MTDLTKQIHAYVELAFESLPETTPSSVTALESPRRCTNPDRISGRRQPRLLAAAAAVLVAAVVTLILLDGSANPHKITTPSGTGGVSPREQEFQRCLESLEGEPTWGAFDHGTNQHVEMDPRTYCEESTAVVSPYTDDELQQAHVAALRLFRGAKFVIEYVEYTTSADGSIGFTDSSKPVSDEEVARRIAEIREGG